MELRPVAFVTGASAGIGREVCRTLAHSGYNLIALARRRERLEELVTELAPAGCHVHPLVVDLRNREALFEAVSSLPEPFAAIDVLVNNAGLALGVDPLQQGDPAEWDIVLDTNVRALLSMLRAVVPGMIERGKGQIVNIGSIAGRQTYPGGAVYCASKAAELALTRGLGIDLVHTPLRVTTIDPGLVETEFSVVRFRGDQQRADAVYHDLQPLRPEDVAEAVRWVVSQPAHVQVSEIVLFPTCQAAAMVVHRGPGA